MVHIEREDGRESMAPGEWRQRIAVFLAGIAAEKLVFGAFTNGGGSDLAHSTGLIAMALRKWGWSSRGPVSVPAREESEALKSWLEDEAADMSRKIFAGVESWLGERREMLMAFAGELEARRELSGPSLASWRATVVSGGALNLESESEGSERSGAFGQEWSKRPFATLHRE
jgi:ATP-dependent Zn protease